MKSNIKTIFWICSNPKKFVQMIKLLWKIKVHSIFVHAHMTIYKNETLGDTLIDIIKDHLDYNDSINQHEIIISKENIEPFLQYLKSLKI